jgi:hypothetical protein
VKRTLDYEPDLAYVATMAFLNRFFNCVQRPGRKGCVHVPSA